METFTCIKGFLNDPSFRKKRMGSLEKLDLESIDEPILDIITHFAKLDCCFTLQSCCGHFLYDSQQDPNCVEPLPLTKRDVDVDYRIAYIALCIENSDQGLFLFNELKKVPFIDKEYIQFGCAEWFWEQHSNSFALQVEPERYMLKDRIVVDYSEALHIQEIRGYFFDKIRELLKSLRI